MTDMDIFTLSEKLRSREISARELTRRYLDVISKRDGEIGAYISVDEESALKAAEDTDRRRLRGEVSDPLAGIPFAVKDNICIEGMRATCGSEMLKDFVSPYTATTVERLRERGAVVLGKTNMDEFAMGSATDTSVFGCTKNPLDESVSVGGSSGGSAAAVASDMCAFALGSDTGGSARLPAAFCGLAAMKPTYGRVSRYGLIAFACSLEQISPMTRSVRDNALVLGAICGRDPRDATSLERGNGFMPVGECVKGKRIGVPWSALDGVSESVRCAVIDAADSLRSMGAEIEDTVLPNADVALAAYYVISSAEASSNLARYDGVRYGYRSKGEGDIDSLFVKSRTQAFGDEVKRRLMLGTFCLSGEGREAYYKRALAAKRMIRRDLEGIFDTCDALLMPVYPSVAYKLEDKKRDPLAVWKDDALCVYANLGGFPSLSVPFGAGEGGIPTAVQLMGRAFDEKTLYEIAIALADEEITDVRKI